MTSHPDLSTKVSLTDLTDRKSRGEKLVMVTAYDHPGARLADALDRQISKSCLKRDY